LNGLCTQQSLGERLEGDATRVGIDVRAPQNLRDGRRGEALGIDLAGKRPRPVVPVRVDVKDLPPLATAEAGGSLALTIDGPLPQVLDASQDAARASPEGALVEPLRPATALLDGSGLSGGSLANRVRGYRRSRAALWSGCPAKPGVDLGRIESQQAAPLGVGCRLEQRRNKKGRSDGDRTRAGGQAPECSDKTRCRHGPGFGDPTREHPAPPR
jgi:hypothetical protein